MIASFVVAVLLSSPLFVLADPTPTAPGPGEVFKVGSTCHTAWDADTAANSPWKVMNIELMSGSNFDMKSVTTLTVKPVDGTVSGFLDFPCPAVTVYSEIYFCQYSSPSPNVQKSWSTRFTIADASGQSVAPPNAVQPTSGDKIGWGIGALVDQSKVVPPPVGGGGNGAAAAAAPAATGTASGAASSMAATAMVTSTMTPAASATSSPTVSSDTVSVSPVNAKANPSGTATSGSGVTAMTVDIRFLGALIGLAAFMSLL